MIGIVRDLGAEHKLVAAVGAVLIGLLEQGHVLLEAFHAGLRSADRAQQRAEKQVRASGVKMSSGKVRRACTGSYLAVEVDDQRVRDHDLEAAIGVLLRKAREAVEPLAAPLPRPLVLQGDLGVGDVLAHPRLRLLPVLPS